MKAPEIVFSTPEPVLEQAAEDYRTANGAGPANILGQQALDAGKAPIGAEVDKWTTLPGFLLAFAKRHLEGVLPALTPEFHALAGSTLNVGWEAQLLSNAKTFFATQHPEVIPNIEPLARLVVEAVRVELRKTLTPPTA